MTRRSTYIQLTHVGRHESIVWHFNTSRTLMTGDSPKVFGESANGFASFDQPLRGIWKPPEHFGKMMRRAGRRVSRWRGQTLAQRYGEVSLRNTGGVCGTTIIRRRQIA